MSARCAGSILVTFTPPSMSNNHFFLGTTFGARRLLAFASIAVVAVACKDSTSPVRPLQAILVQSATLVEVNDTVHVTATAFESTSIGTLGAPLPDASWRISDPAIASLSVSPQPARDGYSRAAIVGGLRSGVVWVTVSARGVSGVDTIRVIPLLDHVTVRAARDTIAVGDTIDVAITAFDGTGQPVSDIPFTYGYSGEVRVISYSKTWIRIVAQSPGVAVVTAQVRRLSGRTSFVVKTRAS